MIQKKKKKNYPKKSMIQKYEWVNITSTIQTVDHIGSQKRFSDSRCFCSIISKVATSASVSRELVIPDHFYEGLIKG